MFRDEDVPLRQDGGRKDERTAGKSVQGRKKKEGTVESWVVIARHHSGIRNCQWESSANFKSNPIEKIAVPSKIRGAGHI